MSPQAATFDPAERLVRKARRRLAAITLVTVASLVVAVGLTTAFSATTLMHRNIDRALEAAAADPARLHELMDEDELGRTRSLGEADTFVMLVDADGYVLGNTSDVGLAGLPDRAAILSSEIGEDRRQGTYDGVDVRLLTRRLPGAWVEDEALARGPVFLQAGFVLTLHEEQERELLLAIAMLGLLGILGAAVITLVVTRRALAPIREAFATERRFVAAASHELRTPAAVIRASAEILEREGLVDVTGRPLVEDIVSETDRMGRLVGDLLALASADAGAISLDPRPLEVAGWFEDLARRAGSIVETRGLVLRTSHGAFPGPVVITADRERLDQLLLILVDNAIQHSPPGGVVTLGLSVDRLRRAVTVTVTDQGPGIAPQDRERIFEPFIRLPGRRPAQRGSGLGLAIARQLAARHGAELTVVGEAGQGAAFQLRLSLTSERVTTKVLPAQQHAD